MMSDESYFAMLDISTSTRDYEILKVIIELYEASGTSLTFKEIEDKINSIQKESFTKQWIYKCLKNLEESRFITVDRINRPTTFSANLMDLRNGLSKVVRGKIEDIEKQIMATEKSLSKFEQTSVYDLAYYFVDTLSGKKSERISGSIEGRMNVRQSLILEICERTKPGDVIRINNRTNLIDFSSEEADSVEKLIIQSIVSKGLILKALLNTESFQIFKEYGSLSELVEDNQEMIKEGLSNGSLEIRAPHEDKLPYRMITINNDKMFMFLADTPNPDTVAIIYREGNPLLIDEAIENFEESWKDSTNLSDQIKDLIDKAS